MTPLFFVDLGHQEGKKGRQALRLGGSSVVVNVRLRPLFAAISFPVVAALILDLQSSCLESDVEPKGGDVQLAICLVGYDFFITIIYGQGITERHTMFLHSKSLKSTL
jgi:hypothetical protein